MTGEAWGSVLQQLTAELSDRLTHLLQIERIVHILLLEWTQYVDIVEVG